LIARPCHWIIATLLLCLAVSHEISAAATAEKLKVVTLHGTRHFSLHQWARIKGFTLDWDKPNKIVHVRNTWAKLSFQANSKRASCNESTLWLCSSVLVSNDALYISERDVYKTLHPILFPEKLPKGKHVKTVVIAAGHGGKDPGNMVNREQEKKYTLLLAKELKDALAASGFKVIMTRESDKFIDLEPQAVIANRARADLFITVHYNAVADINPKGIETFCLTPAGAVATNGGTPSPRSPGNKFDSFNALLAYQVHKHILRSTDFEDRGIRRAGFLVLRHLEMPGILIEGGFMSNPADAKKIYSAAHRKTVARAIADAVLTYKRLVERN
jgi:N-acetylmuramoyl-L-alanine amidase